MRRTPSHRMLEVLSPVGPLRGVVTRFMDPCARCEAAYQQCIRNGHIGSTITCPVCGRHALRP